MEKGTRLGNTYRIVRKLGSGGEGSVYLAIHERSCRLWAVKEISKKRYLLTRSEVTCLKHLSHPGLPKLMDVLESPAFWYLILEYIPGRSLEEILQEEGPQKQKQILLWMLQLCQVLEYLHSRDPAIVYGDMKPSNVIQKDNGRLVLIDFGAARREGWENPFLSGTKEYAAPEQCQEKGQVDGRTDIYSLGVTMYRMFTGKFPEESVRYFRKYPGREIKKILLKCIQKEKNARYPDCRNLQRELEKIRKKPVLLAVSLAALLTGAAGSKKVLTEVKKQQRQEEQYQLYVNSNQIQKIRSAILLSPDREEAYQKLLEEILEDYQVTEQEDEQVRRIMGESAASLKTDAYARISYELGIAYWYYSAAAGGKRQGARWFSKALESDALEEEKAVRASIFQGLGEIYERLERKNETGDGPVSYQELWRKCLELVTAAREQENEVTALQIWNECASIQYSYMDEFQKAGVSKEEMEDFYEALKQGEANIQGDDNHTVLPGLRKELTEKLRLIKEAKERLYEREEKIQ